MLNRIFSTFMELFYSASLFEEFCAVVVFMAALCFIVVSALLVVSVMPH